MDPIPCMVPTSTEEDVPVVPQRKLTLSGLKYKVMVGVLLTTLVVVSTALTIHLHLTDKYQEGEEEVKRSNSDLVKSLGRRPGVQNHVSWRSEDDTYRAYSPWSGWSRCSTQRKGRGCRQRRVRSCEKPRICGNAVIKMKRGCTSQMCTGWKWPWSPDRSQKNRGKGEEEEGGHNAAHFHVMDI